jgi:low temperature requirement protein LtrA
MAGRRLRPMAEGDKSVPFELFFDLVFVYAITQVTGLMAHDTSAQGIVRGLLVLGVLWWCWSGFVWLGNTARLDEGMARAALLAVMAAMFVIALSIPEVFHDKPGGVSAPVVFVTGYFVVRLIHQLLYMRAAGGDAGLRRQLAVNWIPWTGGVLLLMLSTFAHGWPQTGLWAAALGWDYGGVLLAGISGWRVTSAAHFAERHALVIIIAIGESIVAIGTGATGLAISWPIVIAAILAIGVASTLWWAYFDVVAITAERRLTQANGLRRTILATQGYTYLHLPLMAGIILAALGIEEVLAYAGGSGGHEASDALHGTGLYALYGGVALYLLAHVLFGRRMFGTWNRSRIVTIAAIVITVPVANVVPAIAALALLAAILAGMVGYETVMYAASRAAIRSGRT